MKTFVGMTLSIALIVALIFGMSTATSAVTSEPNPPAGAPATSAPPPQRDRPGLNIVKGEVLKIEGREYIIRDMAGKELRLEVDAGTKIEGAPKVGDRIELELSSARRAAAIKKVR